MNEQLKTKITSDECKAMHSRCVADWRTATTSTKMRAMRKLAEALGKAAAVLIAEETTDAMKL